MTESSDQGRDSGAPPRIFHGWWIVVAAFLNLFFSVGVIYYGLPVYYPEFVSSLGFTRAQVTQGFLVGFLAAGLPFSLLAGVAVDRVGARPVILAGLGFVGLPLILMGFISRFWQYEVLCVLEVVGYALAGPIANQVLVSCWFRVHRGRAMGYAYLGLGLGGVVAPVAANLLIHLWGWRTALEWMGFIILAVLFPVGIWVTRSTPRELGLQPDGACLPPALSDMETAAPISAGDAMRTRDFWLILVGSTLTLGAINGVIQHFILFLNDQGYGLTRASRLLSALLLASLGGRVVVGYLADRFQRRDTMALFYLVLGSSIPLLFMARQPAAAWIFVFVFGFAMGADYMLIPLVTAERFGVAALGRILAIVMMANSILQWLAPWLVGRLFDIYANYKIGWALMAAAAIAGALAIRGVSAQQQRNRQVGAVLPCEGNG